MTKTDGRIYIKDPVTREAALEIKRLDKRYPTITDAIRAAVLDMLERIKEQQATATQRPTPRRGERKAAS